ncbi:MAG: biotin--[acetyl-CoA-carboxylase] ligase [Candidatus Dadabacteria bacterium]|nr:biotin--[acetyl-CoA-carboxylase] ligase [Candidatus Dadabacteria bacterium]NIS07404.1 biotin--[acetyl-CoA-carboxylase] ligase [Candidatus Dadabacteria bacterium]NIV41436.1 biotin--[acetyl-CoA-carboxylase] ligase [Candidatus Dadabacteria bacterium]NIY21060.1 biotin--[acetyl-CoA-carboxylase] ligase [Candidatus Dadabacteria bacterium]
MYKLDKDLVFSNLTKNHIGRKLIILEEVDSTNDYAMKLVNEKYVSGSVVIADIQYAGKGRLERKWHSPRGLNLYMSFILSPRIKAAEVNILTFISSIATVDTLAKYSIQSEIKWPNDVLINAKKVSGVLTEINMVKNKLEHVVAGIGVNLNMDSDALLSSGLSEIATSVYIENGKPVNRNEFLITLLNNLDVFYDNFMKLGKEYIYNQWSSRWYSRDKPVRVVMDNEQFDAICKGLDKEGFMIVQRDSGQTVKIVSADVSPL